MSQSRRPLNADPANAARYQPDRMIMGQLRTANNRCNRAVRNRTGRAHAAAGRLTAELPAASASDTKATRTAS